MKQTQKQKKNAPQGEPSMATLFANLRYSLPAAIGIFLLSIFLFALALYFLDDPSPFVRPLAICASAIASFCGGSMLCKKQGNSALLCGMVNGCFFLCILLLISLFFRKYASGYSPLVSAALHLGVLFASILGGYAGLPRQKRKKRK